MKRQKQKSKTKQKKNEKTEAFFITVTNFNETSIAKEYIGSDYFHMLIIIIKVHIRVAKSYNFIKTRFSEKNKERIKNKIKINK